MGSTLYLQWFCLFMGVFSTVRGFHVPHVPIWQGGKQGTATATVSSMYMSSYPIRSGEGVLQDAHDIKVGPLKYETIPLATGLSIETLSQVPSSRSEKRSKQLPPLLFIHGSFHGAWCWAEHWMPFLASRGYDTYAISLRGTSGTPVPGKAGRRNSIKAEEHVSDVMSFIRVGLGGRAPIIISHSFGGVVCMKLLEEAAEAKKENGASLIAGAALFCSVPPSGNGPMTGRFLRDRPGAAFKIVLGFVLRLAASWPWLARDMFFSPTIENSTLNRYMPNFRADSKVGIDLRDLVTKLPSKRAREDGSAEWLGDAPARAVFGAAKDFIVDEEGVKETARFLGVEHEMLPYVPHDVMLGRDWTKGAERVLAWLERTDFSKIESTVNQ